MEATVRPLDVCLTEVPAGRRRVQGTTRLALETAVLWDTGQEVSFGFLDGEAWKRELVVSAIDRWTRYANLRLVEAPAADAMVRVTFDTLASHSVVGRRVLDVPKAQAATHLALDPDRDPAITRAIVLHELGHALGAVHEHSSPGATIPWDEDAVYRHYLLLGRSRDWTDRQVLRRYDPGEVQASTFDLRSIMLYPIDGRLTGGRLAVPWNLNLSEHDKAFMRAIYPGRPNVAEIEVDGDPWRGRIAAPGAAERVAFVVHGEAPINATLRGPSDLRATLLDGAGHRYRVFGPGTSSVTLNSGDYELRLDLAGRLRVARYTLRLASGQ